MRKSDQANPKFARDAWLRALQRSASIERNLVPLPMLIDQLALRYESAAALESPESCLSYRELACASNRYARWALGQGLRAGEATALMMYNCSEYVAVWLGLTRIGVTVALINTNLRAAALEQSIQAVAPRLIIVGANLATHVIALRARLTAAIWVRGETCGDVAARGYTADYAVNDCAVLDVAGADLSGEAMSVGECAAPPLDATALHIYTSGTTGLPKAARVSHWRLLQWSHWFAGMLNTGPSDRMYDCLPLYHSVGGVVAVGATLLGGGAVVIRKRFSAKDFWRDVVEQGCTLFQYIGELCRYLVNSPQDPQEAAHVLRLACGNGLRAEVWETFQTRFRIPRILEYYASTEGNFSLYNCEGEVGAIGRIPPFLAQRNQVALLRFDVERGEPVRNAAGLCEAVGVDEAGEAVGLMPATGERAGRFEGYVDAEASARKLLHDVFARGDVWYRTGDLMRRDARGFYYFIDRVGETYRWKGENVSTLQVWSVLAASRGVLEGVVYGVSVPGADGRAGMAALVVNGEFDLAALRSDVVRLLPSYARPVFVRLIPALQSTDTFKPRKQELQAQGFDPAKVADPLYFDNQVAGCYVVLDQNGYASILAGERRL